jgi:uncharacterized phage infection (PIP) family protein YhgE
MASALLAFLTKEKAGELAKKLEDTTAASGSLKSDNVKLKEEKKTASEKIGELNNETASVKTQVETLRAEISTKEKELAALQQSKQEAAAQIAKLKKQIEETSVPVVPAKDPIMEEKLATLDAELKKQQQAAADEKAKLTQQIEQLKVKVTEASKTTSAGGVKVGSDGKPVAQSARPPSGVIVAYNEGWNFVVVNLGDKNGVTPESKLVVFRGGKAIAKLKITEVQPTHSSAGLIYPEGRNIEAVQTGDLVVFSKPEAAAADPSPNLRAAIP